MLHKVLNNHYLGWFIPRVGTKSLYRGVRSTTILAVRRKGQVVLVGDGQVTQNQVVMKPNAVKVRTLGGNSILCGFAGATADCITLREILEGKLEKYPGQLVRACVEFAKDWRKEKYLRNLDAMLVVADKDASLVVTGAGDVIEPKHDAIAIGSGGTYATAAAIALLESDVDYSAEEIALRSMKIASDMCVYTNDNFTIEKIDVADKQEVK